MVDVPPVIRIFAQGQPELDLPRLLAAARTHFSASLEVLHAPPPPMKTAHVRLEGARSAYSGDFEITARAARPEDHSAADQAELAGRAAGMAGLARRCPNVWEIRRVDAARPWDEDAALLNLCAILASVALGPVLPPDSSTLFGVRGAMERVERSLGRRTLER
ncbi:MAG TPA: hypothetical protein VM686_40125 [Polyangiaceae bacterium]|nr:hypothetical protein [Polyangiaceae bacterium]